MQVLLVDDNAEDRQIVTTLLRRSGYETTEARDGEEGVALAASLRPDVIIADVHMSGMDGYQLLREVRRRPELAGTTFIFYTGVYVDEQDRDLALSLGADGVIGKVTDPALFMPLFQQVLASSPPASRISSESLEDGEYIRRFGKVAATKLEKKIHDLERANGLLEESRSLYRNLFNSIRDVIVVTDPLWVVIDVNESALQTVFGYERGDLLGQSIRFLCPEIVDCIDSDGASEVEPRELDLVDKAGVHKRCEVALSRITDEKGRLVGYVGIFRDITERLKLEEQLRLSQKIEAIGTLTGGIAHDFNNILTAIVGFASLMQMKMPQENPFHREVRHILEAAERAASLTNGLLAFSRKQVIKPVPVSINSIVADMKRLLSRIIGEDIHFYNVLSEGEPVAQVDRGQIEQVVMNLILNARDALGQGGEIAVGTDIRILDERFVQHHGFGEARAYAVITVSDTGVGMDEETRQRVFEPFFTTKVQGKGTGLGLAVVYGIIKQHNGFITCDSDKGGGTTFTVYLPLTDARVGTRTSWALSEKDKGKETVLLAEDDPGVRLLMVETLEEGGYRVHAVEDGAEAVERFKQLGSEVDLLLFDLIMPRKNGREALEEIRRINPRVRCLFMSGYTADILEDKGMLGEGVPLISKPVTPHALLEAVRKSIQE